MDEERDLKSALLRGWRLRCPACGEGKLMDGYLTVRDGCASCGSEMHHHRADDGPAWATILIVGHILAPVMLFVFVAWRPSAVTMAVGFSALLVALSLYLLPRLKGLFVGIQWAKRMHGFGGAANAAGRA